MTSLLGFRDIVLGLDINLASVLSCLRLCFLSLTPRSSQPTSSAFCWIYMSTFTTVGSVFAVHGFITDRESYSRSATWLRSLGVFLRIPWDFGRAVSRERMRDKRAASFLICTPSLRPGDSQHSPGVGLTLLPTEGTQWALTEGNISWRSYLVLLCLHSELFFDRRS